MSETAPGVDPERPWPIHGLAYVAVFMGPLSAGPGLGLVAGSLKVGVVGLVFGVAIDLLNAKVSDKYFDPLVGRFQTTLLRPVPRVMVNIAAFAWAFLITGLAMVAPLAVFGLSAIP